MKFERFVDPQFQGARWLQLRAGAIAPAEMKRTSIRRNVHLSIIVCLSETKRTSIIACSSFQAVAMAASAFNLPSSDQQRLLRIESSSPTNLVHPQLHDAAHTRERGRLTHNPPISPGASHTMHRFPPLGEVRGFR